MVAPVPTADRRRDRVWGIGSMAVAAALFLSTTSSNVHFGDSAEGVAGVATLGILHAPGYVAWVALARLFSEVVPIGGLTFRVALFGVVCATATVGLVFASARRLGASAPGAAVGALSLAVSTSFWFYAPYAKAYALTSLLIALTLWCVLAWRSDGGRWHLVIAGLAVGLSLGAAWQSMVVALPGFALLLLTADRRPSWRDLTSLIGTGVAAAAGVMGWVMVRASADPMLSWGGASNPGAAARLLLMRDFVTVQGTGAGTARGDSVASGENILSAFTKLLRIPFFLTADLGLPLLALVVVGAVVALRGPLKRAGRALALVYALNVVAVTLVIAPGRRSLDTSIGRETLLRTGGFTLAAGVALACFTALGATWALDRVARALAPKVPQRRSAGRASDRRRARQAAAASSARPAPWPVLVAVGLVLASTAAYHWRDASHHAPPLAEDYGRNVLSSLPDDTVLITNLLERNFTLEYQQAVNHLRPDVDLVQVEKLPAAWYRNAVEERLGVQLDHSYASAFEAGLALADQLRGRRPVYFDASALASLAAEREDLGYRAMGLVAESLPDGGSQSFDADRTAALFDGYRLDGLFDDPARLQYPNRWMLRPYVTSYSDLGTALAQHGRLAEAREAFDRARQIAPDDRNVAELLRQLDVLAAGQSAADN